MAAKWTIDVKRTDNGYNCDPTVVVPMQIRSPYSDLKIEELAQQMLSDGRQKDPVTCRRVNGVPHLLDGNRRLAAIKWINEKVPVEKPWTIWFVLQTVEDEFDALLTAATLNATLPMNPIDKAHLYNMLLTEGQLTQDALGAKIGKTAAHISQHLSLLRLGEKEQRAIAAGKIAFSAALDLCGLSQESRDTVVEAVEAAEKPLSGQEVKEVVANARREETSSSNGEAASSKIVIGLGGLRKALEALAEKQSTFRPIANVIDMFLRGQMSQEDLEDEWGTFIQKLHFDYLEKLKEEGKVRK